MRCRQGQATRRKPFKFVTSNIYLQHYIETLKLGRMQHMKFIARNKQKIWKPKQHEIPATLPPHNILPPQLRS